MSRQPAQLKTKFLSLAGGPGTDIWSVIANILGSGVKGALLMALAGGIKKVISK